MKRPAGSPMLTSQLVCSWTLGAAVSCVVSCSSSDAGGSRSDGAAEAPNATVSDDGPSADAGSSNADAPGGDEHVEGGASMCPSFASGQIVCSRTCYGQCYGTNDASVADPGNHIGDCFFTATGNIVTYCAPWDASDPCSHCP